MTAPFYVTMPSNSSLSYYEQNRTSKYVTQLRQRITLNGEWEVALTEIHFPQTFFNVTKGENVIRVTLKDGRRTFLNVRPDHYRDKYQLLDVIDALLEGVGTTSVGRMNEVEGFVRFQPARTDIDKLKLSPLLARQLGYEPDGLNLASTPDATSPMDLSWGVPRHIYCYCDLIEGQYVGDTVAPLLRIVNTKHSKQKFGDETSVTYQTPIYLPVVKREFQTIAIDMRDHTGRTIPFAFGTSSVQLHFRPRNKHE